jgi:transaldolase
MKFFLDTANLDEIRLASKWGIVDGITTNPTLIAKEGRAIHEQIGAICGVVDGPVSAEVVETNAKAMIREGRELARIHKNVVVKCPLTRDGIEACAALTREGIHVNVTLCFSAAQALVAAKAGAWFISPFVGRLDDIGQTGMDVVRQTVAIYRNFGFGTQVLAASLRGPQHVIESALAGAHIGTMPFKVMDALFNHPLTDKGLEQFLKDYHKVFTPEPAAAR